MSVEYVGPLKHYDVVVNGWRVPLLTAWPQRGGILSLTLDNRIGCDIQLADAETFVPFLAHAIAIAAGFASHPDGGRELKLVPAVRPTCATRVDLEQHEEHEV